MLFKLVGLISCVLCLISIGLTIYYFNTENYGCPKLIGMWCSIGDENYYSIYGIYDDNISRRCGFGRCSTDHVDKNTVNCSVVSNRTCYASEFHKSISSLCDSGCYNHKRDNLFASFFFASFILVQIAVPIFSSCIILMIIDHCCRKDGTKDSTEDERRPFVV